MPTPGLGHKVLLRFSEEAAYGVAETGAADAVFEVVSTPDLDANLTFIDDPNMQATKQSPRNISQGLQFITGGFRIRVGYEGFERLWKWLLPTYSSAQPDSVGDAAVRDHTFKEGVTAVSATLEFDYQQPTATPAMRFTGALCTGFRFSLEPGGGQNAILVADITFAAQDMASVAAGLTGSSVANDLPIPFHHARTAILTGSHPSPESFTYALKDGGGGAAGDMRIRGFNLSVEVPYDTQRAYLTSINADDPVRDGLVTATIEFDEEWNDKVLMDNALANTPTAIDVLFQHPTSIGATTRKRELHLIASSPTPTGFRSTVVGFSVIRQRVVYRLAYNATDASYLKVRTRNTQSALT